jgi:4-hydroxybenzoate polyprenyltransferase
MICLCFAIALIAISFQLSESGPDYIGGAISVAAGICLLIIPALRLHLSKSRSAAMALFNKSSYYPVALFASAIVHTMV